MSNPSGPDEDRTPDAADEQTGSPAEQAAADAPTEQVALHPDHEPATEIIGSPTAVTEAVQQAEERRFTAPSGFDGSTQKIDSPPDPETEVFAPQEETTASAVAAEPPKSASPQVIPPREDAPPPPPQPAARRSWGWVVAVVLVIAALVAIAVLGTVLLTRDSSPLGSEEDRVRETIQNFDVAIQRGDLATLRSITCGSTRDNYVNYDQRAWDETHSRVAAAKQYPVVASIDQVVVNGDHAEANVTTFMAFAPQTRSTRSFDLQFRDDQWKICQAPVG
ncbi:Rv0361 family membrane protein [Mycolicibacterium sp. XJ870]